MKAGNSAENLISAMNQFINDINKKKDKLLSSLSDEQRKQVQEQFSKIDLKSEQEKLRQAFNDLRNSL